MSRETGEIREQQVDALVNAWKSGSVQNAAAIGKDMSGQEIAAAMDKQREQNGN